jgi:NAD(P)H dehydrogenase (quinone)
MGRRATPVVTDQHSVNVFIVYWHPEPKSFNHALFDTARAALAGTDAEVRTSDLHAMAFDPVSSRANFRTVKHADYLKLQQEELHAAEVGGFTGLIDGEIQKMEWCDLMIWQFPLWWFGLPAALKGWVDRVFAMGRTYGGGRVYDTGDFRGKRAMLSFTTGGPEAAYVDGGRHGDMMGVLRPIHRGMLQFVGFDVLSPQIVYGAARLTDEQRQQELQRYRQRLMTIAGEQPVDIGRY